MNHRVWLTTLLLWAAGQAGLAAERIAKDTNGVIHVHPLPVDKQLNNPWPAEWEKGLLERANSTINVLGKERMGGTTHGESEKDVYPRAMFHFLAGDRAAALRVLQAEDAQAQSDHQHTLGMDYYWCFTLKGQARKFFFFGDYLNPAYKKRMFDAARIWTEQEPLRRSHPVYGKGDPKQGVWGPENKGSWVDVRDTDNLRAMRDTSVYLLAEVTGNEATRQLYKRKILSYVLMLYHVGMREWDSSNYHSHMLSPYHNLFDFAKDPEVKLLAKAALDWLYTAGALKYYRGGFGGPRLRDYGGATVPFGGNAIHPLELYFGDAPMPDPDPDRDDVYPITSAYRPPQAVVYLARKKFPRPFEMLGTKPPYRLWNPGEPFAPRFWETLFIANSYQMGSAVAADSEKAWNPSVFNLMAYNSRRGVDYFAANTTPIWEHSVKLAGDQVGQYRNLLIWLRPARSEQPFYFQIPESAKSQFEDGVWFLAYEKTWLAVRRINLALPAEIQPEAAMADSYHGQIFLKAESRGTSYAGFALEVGEVGSYENFKKDVKTRSKLDLSELENGTVELVGRHGGRLKMTHNRENDLPLIVRNGVEHDWEKHLDLYQPVSGTAPVSLGWQKGTLRVEAGGKVFEETVAINGKVIFNER